VWVVVPTLVWGRGSTGGVFLALPPPPTFPPPLSTAAPLPPPPPHPPLPPAGGPHGHSSDQWEGIASGGGAANHSQERWCATVCRRGDQAGVEVRLAPGV